MSEPGQKTKIDADKLKEGVDQLLQRDQLDNDKAHAGDKPRLRNEDDASVWDKAKETLKDVHD